MDAESSLASKSEVCPVTNHHPSVGEWYCTWHMDLVLRESLGGLYLYKRGGKHAIKHNVAQ